jgi:hypothetical protein
MKKTRSQKSRDTVPLKSVITYLKSDKETGLYIYYLESGRVDTTASGNASGL